MMGIIGIVPGHVMPRGPAMREVYQTPRRLSSMAKPWYSRLRGTTLQKSSYSDQKQLFAIGC